MPTMLEVMESRLGIQEMPGKKHNPIIVGWARQIGHEEVLDDETSWCSICACSAAMEANLPLPPHNTRMMARSWLTWGVEAPRDELRPGDVAIWPRGGKTSWKGHVNVVKDVRTYRGKVQVRCIGGNQGGLKGGDAVTLTGWINAEDALDFRRPVEPTVAALKEAGSSEIKSAKNIETALVVTGSTTATVKAVDELGVIDQLKDVGDGAGVIKHAMEGLHGTIKFAAANIWIVVLVGCIALLIINRKHIKQRLARHLAGHPIFGGGK